MLHWACFLEAAGTLINVNYRSTHLTITFMASSRKLIPETVSFFILRTCSSVYTYRKRQIVSIVAPRKRQYRKNGPYIHTLIQHPAISSMRFSNRPHRAAVHCGAVTLVGSVRTRDLYIRLCEGELDSTNQMGKKKQNDQNWHETAFDTRPAKKCVPLSMTSLPILLKSNAPFMRSSTASERSNTRLCTRDGKTRRFEAVCSDVDRRGRF